MLLIKIKPNGILGKLLLRNGKFDGRNLGPISFISKELTGRNKEAVIAHEKEHYYQWKKNPFTFGIKYLFIPEVRYKAELEAYRQQNYIVEAPDTYSYYILNNYKLDKLNLTIEKIKNDLLNKKENSI